MSKPADKDAMACNKPRRTPGHATKSHVVKACYDGQEKLIRFGEQGASTAGKPKAGESERMKTKRASFKARHSKNIAKGPSSPAYWANKVKWAEGGEVKLARGGNAAMAMLEQMKRAAAAQPQEFDILTVSARDQRNRPRARASQAPLQPRQQAVPQQEVEELPLPPMPPSMRPDENPPPEAPRNPMVFDEGNPHVATAIRMAERYNLPRDIFLSLVQQESGFNPAARSRRGAIGLGQLMPATAKELGVDPLDPEQNLEGSARYLRQMLDRFKDMPVALAAYNAGPGRVARAGNTIPNIRETQQYVPSILRRAGMPGYAHGGLAELHHKYAEGGLAETLGAMGRNGDSLVAHITPREAQALKAMGGAGTINPRTGLLEFYDADGDGGSATDSSNPTGGDDGSGKSGSESMSISDFGGTAHGIGISNKSDPDFGPTSQGVVGREFGTAPLGTFGSTIGTAIGLGTGVPGLGVAGTALGTVADVAMLNSDLESMGLPGNVAYGPSLANNMSFGMLGESPEAQFGNIMGFDALAEAPMSAFGSSGNKSAPSVTAEGRDGTSSYNNIDWNHIQREAVANNLSVENYLASRGLSHLYRYAPSTMNQGGLANLAQKYAEGGEVMSDEEYDRRLLSRMKHQTGRVTDPTRAEQMQALRTAGRSAAEGVADVLLPQSPLDAALMVALGPGGRAARLAGSAALASLEPSEAEASRLRRLIRAYHASPHKFDRFDFSKAGTGHGAQNVGAGGYFSEAENVAESFKPRGGYMYEVQLNTEPSKLLDWNTPFREQSIFETLNRITPEEVGIRQYRNRAGQYEYVTPEDLVISRTDTPVQSVADLLGAGTGEDAYRRLAGGLGWRQEGDRRASEFLRQYDVSGIRYNDIGNKSTDGVTSNYVIFDPEIIDIRRRYAEGGLAQLEQKYAEGGEVSAMAYDPDAVDALVKEIEAEYV